MSGTNNKWPILDPLDNRLNAYTDELADKHLEDKVQSEKYVLGAAGKICSFFADLKAEPDEGSGLNTQILFGENVNIFDSHDGWSWVQSVRDRYVGWTKSSNLNIGFKAATHWVFEPRTFLYPVADMKKPRSGYRSIASRVRVTDEVITRGTKYYLLKDGEAVFADHLRPIDEFADDYVSVAETLLYTPYLWGGATGFGIDCSGLVQISMRMAGLEVLRDSDMQAATCGEPIEAENDWSNIERGDLVFWKGHVGICQGMKHGKQQLIHANGHTMNVASEPLVHAIERIEHLYEKPIGVRRPPKLKLEN